MAGFFRNLIAKITGSSTEEIDWDRLEAQLIAGDLGPRLAVSIVDELRKQGRKLSGQDIVTVARQHVKKSLPETVPPLKRNPDGRPRVVLVLGVNGVGKTTSVAKLAHLLQQQGHSLVLAAADTFRAAAVEQLQVWGQRLSIPVVSGPPNCDPSGVCFEGYARAVKEKADYLLVDTAGRLHTKHNLMEELKKLTRTLAKKDSTAPHEVLLVVDATTGANALAQAREFHKAVPLTGLIVTKLDGSGKGGILVPIYTELKVPTRFIGLGETATDFRPFDSQQFVEELL